MMDNQELKARIDNILSGENCRHIEANLPCNHRLENTKECRDCQTNQLLTFAGNRAYFEEAATEYCRELGWSENE